MGNARVRISIVTVVYNSATELEKTIKNIISQTFDNIEYIIIDGQSTDGTLETIKKYSDHIDTLLSEMDKGLYDAMNKGLELATGDYIVFMNAGDVFPCKGTLANVANKIQANKCPDFVYGDVTEITMNGNKYLRESRSLEAIKIGMFTCHQSMYYKNQIVKENNLSFNLDYNVFSDYNFTCKFLNASKNNLHINEPLSIFEFGGLSTQCWYEGLLENNKTRKTILKMSFFKRMAIHYAQVLWHLVKFKAPLIHRFLRYKKHEG